MRRRPSVCLLAHQKTSAELRVGVNAIDQVMQLGRIPAADQDRIFEDFQQIDNSITRQKGGTGPGLSIARRLLTAHGGRIDLRSTPGVGSTFTLFLPIRAADQRQAA